MDLGNAIVAAVTIFSTILGAVILICKINKKESPTDISTSCLSHSGMKEAIENIKNDIGEIKDNVREFVYLRL